jgi:hypothetical protein
MLVSEPRRPKVLRSGGMIPKTYAVYLINIFGT